MAHCGIAHTEILRRLMLMLSEWPDDTRVSLSIGLDDKRYRQSKNPKLHHFNVVNPQLLPIMPCVRSLRFSFCYQPRSPRRNVEGDFLLMQKFPNLESFHLDAPEFPFFIKPRREIRKSLINTLSYQFPTSARHGKLIILPNKYGPFQQLPQMIKDGKSDPLFSPPPSLDDAVPYWQNMTKLKVDCDMVSPSGERYLKHYNTRLLDLLRSAGRMAPGLLREGDAEEPVWKADVSELVRRRNIERSYLENDSQDRQ
ncbi:uncharacterized protein BDZ83DRAFT_754187 [Colletotrichum acutatum]|uniref:Uncharacterized protein n=1 Tax=Glomerella acutata TaxID=27357 RepID=A0AAD8UGE9_GLOAC|nr:uncharacterized protein BDZ83DRAFT_754187 [Colletotrichum acutatum]KAK1722643.1 hypothetical protein BDZ83DRAFT_754187 [Colletotrichum acutatum]